MSHIVFLDNSYKALENFLISSKVKKIFFVHGNSYRNLPVREEFESIVRRNKIQVFEFTDFQSNPNYDSVVKGVTYLQNFNPDLIFAVGGGSALDVAKCIKLFGKGKVTAFLLNQENVCSEIPLAVIPTTAGTGSETTRFAVIYANGKKQSITSEKILPETVFFDSSTLQTLPGYQRKSTFLDALCHAIESAWSINSTEVSRVYSAEAIKLLLACRDYINSPQSFVGYDLLFYAAHLAGKAINITETTAGHAMCYKLTRLFKIAHGHAAALCVARLWRNMILNNQLPDKMIFLADCFGVPKTEDAICEMEKILQNWKLIYPFALQGVSFADELKLLSNSVNIQRLKNHPIELSKADLESLYSKILRGVS